MKTKIDLLMALGIVLILISGCKKDESDNDIITDIDGNEYHTVTIGTQVWMVENLKTTNLNDKTPIEEITEGTVWASATTAAYCWYENNDTAYKNTYGALYNWHTVGTGKLCPSGWHVATDKEWDVLIDTLGGMDIAGGKIKSIGTIENKNGVWHDPNTGATDEFGFTAMPGGGRYFNGNTGWMGHYGTYWTSTESSSSAAWTRYMKYNGADVSRDAYPKVTGYSVRCIKD